MLGAQVVARFCGLGALLLVASGASRLRSE